MAGIYIHIPFCKTFCNYCDFYSITAQDSREDFINALIKEAELQANYTADEEIKTIYFGGGTPSLLLPDEAGDILKALKRIFKISENPEVTIEVNPDDVYPGFFSALARLGFNRVSLGVQSWNDRTLKYLGRRHNARQSKTALELAASEGITNISADIIYGIPGETLQEFRSDLETMFTFPIKHLSAYHLTIEEGTRFGKMREQGKLTETDEETSISMFSILTAESAKRGFVHYEISNFAQEGYISLHNSSYWKQVSYLGLGPSAHSFNGQSRQWNISNVKKYISSINKGQVPFEMEELDIRTMFNEYVMTSLRTMWGIDLEFVEKRFDREMADYLVNVSDKFVRYGLVINNKKTLVLTDQGKMISDNIISQLLMVQ
ncbi:MAG TPA: radical SAM family heme chaperone HemW [Bacteroidales bacterium]|nr:radical SAM family heme chaperone HemW [Bacteroidales bacterium]